MKTMNSKAYSELTIKKNDFTNWRTVSFNIAAGSTSELEEFQNQIVWILDVLVGVKP